MTLSLVHARETVLQETYDIDHPADEAYLSLCLAVPSDDQKRALRERFARSKVGTDPEVVIEQLGTVSVQAGIYRQQYERTVVGDGGFGLHSQELDAYKKMAGNPELLADYASWFGGKAHEYFQQTADTAADKRMDKVALELGGKLQGGDWESTEDLDNMIRLLPHQAASVSDLGGVLREGEAWLAPRYRFMPLWTEFDKKARQRGEGGWLPFAFGLIRRRRPVLDLIIQREDESQKIDIYKESLGLVVMSELVDELQDIVRKDVAENPKKNVLLTHKVKSERDPDEKKELVLPESNTAAALAVGGVFEADIKSPPGSSRGIIPVSAHYVVRAIRRATV